MTCRIAILGDSSSSGIGLGESCYPAQLFQMLQRQADVEVFNYAVPGATSADVARFYHELSASLSFDYVIVYLGNNEGAAGPHRGRYRPARAYLSELIFGKHEKQFRPILSPPRFRFEPNVPSAGVAVTPTEFRDNLRLLVKLATGRGARVIVVNPVANRNFPAGVGATNSAYFCYLDDTDKLGCALLHEPTDEPSTALAAGLVHFAEGDFQCARELWQPFASRNDVAGFIASHNLACVAGRLNDPAAEDQFTCLIGRYPSYDCILYYNLAQLKRQQGNAAAADSLLAAAYESDGSLYRIQPAYREVIAGIVTTDRVIRLDLEPILEPVHFVDYCHPTDQGHTKIANALGDIIRLHASLTTESGLSRYQASFPSPNYAKRPGETLLDYYCVDWPLDQERIAAVIEERPGTDRDELVRCIANFRAVNSRHPVFTENIDLTGAWAPRSNEILSYPEFYQYRLLYNYFRAFEQEGIEAKLSSPLLAKFRLSASDYERLILSAGSNALDTDLDLSRDYYDAVKNRIKRCVVSSDQIYRVIIGERLRNVMIWFTREAFRYGTQSRPSMLYARWEIDRVVEGLVVAMVIASRSDLSAEWVELDELMVQTLRLLKIHEQFASSYIENPNAFSVEAYAAALGQVRRSLVSCVEEWRHSRHLT